MTNPENTATQDTELEEAARQAAEEEKKALSEPKLTEYTHRFSAPFSWNGRQCSWCHDCRRSRPESCD